MTTKAIGFMSKTYALKLYDSVYVMDIYGQIDKKLFPGIMKHRKRKSRQEFYGLKEKIPALKSP